MEKVVKTFEEVVDFSNEASNLLTKGVNNDRLKYALIKLVGDPNSTKRGKLASIFREVQRKSIDLQIDMASTDEKGNLLKEGPNAYVYTKENKKALNKALEDLQIIKVEVEPHYVSEEDASELTDFQKEVFKGFVLN